MAIQSVGIGLDRDGEQAIIVGVSGDVVAAREVIADTLEGYPVVIRQTGTIRAQ